MATKRSQRIAIWVIAITMAVGTIGSFLIIILQNDNQKSDQAKLNELTTAYQKDVDDAKAKLVSESYPILKQYASRPTAFDASAVTELATHDLQVGDGEDITSESVFYAFYIGWNPSGKVFDQSIDGETLKDPIQVSPGNIITGWTEGVDGMKKGGVREITIPADKAYGATARGEDIPANTPLKFIIYIPKYDEPQPSADLIKLYTQLQTQ